MQQQQEGGGGSGRPGVLTGYPPTTQAAGAAPQQPEAMIGDQKLGDLGIAEAASPISSRPPATANFDELMRATAEGSGGGGTSGNRWPRQETMALLQIRSDMDAAFRDATPKGPLWEQVSRKLAELGYQRSAKKCKEKFENVHKYYKRTKEGRTGRQDGKSYKFFNQLEALHHSTAAPLATSVNPVHVFSITTNPALLPHSLPPSTSQAQPQVHPPAATETTVTTAPAPSMVPLHATFGISFSSNSSSSSEGDDEDDDDDEDEVGPASADARQQRKRKRGHEGGSGGGIDSDEGMMEFFENLMRQVMQKQEAMQQKFLEAIEKREQDRMIREEAWKRQDMARLAREHELMAQDRAISASRDAAIIAFLQKITGQTIHLPTTAALTPAPPVPISAPPPLFHQEQPPAMQQQQQPQTQIFQHQRDRVVVPSSSHKKQRQSVETTRVPSQPINTSEIIAAVPEQQVAAQDYTGGGLEVVSSRWPKPEILALIQLRSGLESKYLEAGPKGPLWEEISAGMRRMGYNRNAKRCKEKWENINKYYKKVKESKKSRPEDAKTCPYFHELDALYRKKILGNTSGNVIAGGAASSGIQGSWSEQEMQQQGVGTFSTQPLQVSESVDKDVGGKTELQGSSAATFTPSLFGEQSQGATEGSGQPEDIVRKQHQQNHGNFFSNNGSSNKNPHQENEEDNYEDDDENEEYDDDTEEDMKMAYKIQFQRPKVGSSNGQASPPFLAMVQ